MNNLLVIACLALIGLSSAEKSQWELFKSTHGKQYKSIIEENLRYTIFEKNLRRINDHNELYHQGLKTYTMAVNRFADETSEEFLNRLKTNNIVIDNKHQLGYSGLFFSEQLSAELPQSFDWRDQGAVTPVKDQGNCGSGWSFSTTGSLEGHSKIANGKLISLSEEVLLDCSWEVGNQGCNRGVMTTAFDYVIENGIGSEEDFPYREEDGTCTYNKSQSVLSIANYTRINSTDEAELQAAVALVGPVSVSINVTSNFLFYSSGLYDDEVCSSDPRKLNHAVLVVGYGSTDGGDHWIVKNSWGSTWGDAGYIKMSRNKNNQCGIATVASYPNLK